jgi:methionyl-tRNA formyltransferase
LVLEVVQKPGGKKMSALQFLAGYSLKPGDRFTVPE